MLEIHIHGGSWQTLHPIRCVRGRLPQEAAFPLKLNSIHILFVLILQWVVIFVDMYKSGMEEGLTTGLLELIAPINAKIQWGLLENTCSLNFMVTVTWQLLRHLSCLVKVSLLGMLGFVNVSLSFFYDPPEEDERLCYIAPSPIQRLATLLSPPDTKQHAMTKKNMSIILVPRSGSNLDQFHLSVI